MRVFSIIVLLHFICVSLQAQSHICKAGLLEATAEYEEENYSNTHSIYTSLLDKGCVINDFDNLYRMSVASIKLDKLEDAKAYMSKSISVATSDELETINNAEHNADFHGLVDLELETRKRYDALVSHHQELRIFNQSKEYTYSALRISKDGDTIANTTILMIPQGTGWGHEAAAQQSEVVYTYNYTAQDSTNNIAELDSVVTKEFWIKNDTTGIIENEKEVWIHPIRNNQFYKTEIAPFPVVTFSINQITTKTANSQIVIFKNWGTYSPTITDSKYYYEGEQQKEYPYCGKINCHKYSAYAHNSKFGISYLEYFFHEDYGFVEMNYQTYDNEKIEFKLISVNLKKAHNK